MPLVSRKILTPLVKKKKPPRKWSVIITATFQRFTSDCVDCSYWNSCQNDWLFVNRRCPSPIGRKSSSRSQWPSNRNGQVTQGSPAGNSNNYPPIVFSFHSLTLKKRRTSKKINPNKSEGPRKWAKFRDGGVVGDPSSGYRGEVLLPTTAAQADYGAAAFGWRKRGWLIAAHCM